MIGSEDRVLLLVVADVLAAEVEVEFLDLALGDVYKRQGESSVTVGSPVCEGRRMGPLSCAVASNVQRRNRVAYWMFSSAL